MPDLAPDALRLRLLVLRCQVGDDRAFAVLMEQFGARTLGYLRGLVGDAADDLQQEVWLAVLRNIRHLANPGAFRTWLFRTTRHRAIDHLRRTRREQELFAELDDEASGAIEVDDAPLVVSAEMSDALARLPVLQREAMLLRYRDGLSYGEIALVTGCPVGTVRSRLHHAHKRLKELLEQE